MENQGLSGSATESTVSWDEWVSQMVLAGLNAVAIAGLSTGLLWAFTRDFSLDVFELQELSNHLLTGSPQEWPQRLSLGHCELWKCEQFQPPRLLVATYGALAIIVARTREALIVARVFTSTDTTTEDAVKIVQRYAEEIEKYGV